MTIEENDEILTAAIRQIYILLLILAVPQIKVSLSRNCSFQCMLFSPLLLKEVDSNDCYEMKLFA